MGPLGAIFGGRVDQIALVVPNLEAAMDGYVTNLNVSFRVFEVTEATATLSDSSSQFRIRIAIAQGGMLELIQPVSGTTLYTRYLETDGPGLHHLGVFVPDLRRARSKMAARGYRSILEGRIKDLGEFAYFEAPDMHCILEVLHLSAKVPLFLARNAVKYPRRKSLRPA